MKPLVYFDFEEYDNDKNLVLVEKKRLQEILEEVYNAGFADGNNGSQTVTTTPYVYRGDQFYCTDGLETGRPVPKSGVTVTCEEVTR
ncbi:hypothetical protein [Lacrimispora indolis]|uniref:hypothetical protein n=1 Tax=Lacrimispora indolis TaxID=69825 RepID=UPI0004626562|nr:hypothetical protein [[Clostridium] methoxybenzovorans]